MSGSEPTREVFANIAPWMQGVFFLLICLGLGASAWEFKLRLDRWKSGAPGELCREPRIWWSRLTTEVLGQRRVRSAARPRRSGAWLHMALFVGFVGLFVGTTLLAISDKGPIHFHKGAYFLGYEAVMDLFGVALLVGCVLAVYRRTRTRAASLGHTPADLAPPALLGAITLTGFFIEALRLLWDGTPPETARWSWVGFALATGLSPMVGGEGGARAAHLTLWWLHVVMITGLFALWMRTRLSHAVLATLSVLLRPTDRHPGELSVVSLERVEETGQVGLSTTGELTFFQRLSLEACMECGRCEDACPAFASGKPLSPKALIQTLNGAVRSGAEDLATLVGDETLWACTMCQACVFECPVRVPHVDLIAGMRRHRVAEGLLSGPPAQSLRRLGNQGNPFGQPQRERLTWAAGLDVPTVEQNPDFEVLLWVGCAAAFDPRAQRVARATATLLKRAGVSFAVLGRSERCTGDPARRLGEEFLFQQLAQENAETLTEVMGERRRTIVTPCPHCMNSLRNEYPAFDARFEVMHHSRFLADLVATGKLPTAASLSGDVTLHDPCYLARVNGETEAPRAVLAAAGLRVLEMPRHGERTSCCGAGGGRMWFEEPAEQRVNRLRASEAAATGAGTCATACPFCLNMLSDGATAVGGEQEVADLSELLLRALDRPGENEGRQLQ